MSIGWSGDDPGNDIENRIVRFSISYSTIREIVYYDLPNPKLGFSESYSTIFSIVLLHSSDKNIPKKVLYLQPFSKVSSEATEGIFGKSVAYFPIRYRNSGAKSAPLAHSIVVGVNPY